jgi:hypothetical protein
LAPGGAPFFQVTRRQGGTLSGRYRSNGYVLNQVSVFIYFPICRDEPLILEYIIFLPFRVFSEPSKVHQEKTKLQDDQCIRRCMNTPYHPEHVAQTEAYESNHSSPWPLRSD